MNSISVCVFLVCITYISATSLVGHDFEVRIIPTGAEKSEGIKRIVFPKSDPEEWQYFYFCGNEKKNKKPCGVWIDEKGNKIKDANNSNVKKEEDHVVISKSVLGDAGSYTRIPEDKDENQAYIERLDVYVQEGPKPPKI